MKVYANTDPRLGVDGIAAHARRVEAAGFDGMHVSETVHDPFLLAMQALQSTSRIVVRTSVALALVRSPVAVAYTSWDLARLSGGRFELGLGSQIRQNIEDRYAMPWSEPAARMREYVQVVRTAFDAFGTGTLEPFLGEHYRFTRLQPYFDPGPLDVPSPRILVGGVGVRMVAVAGAVADGYVGHPTSSDRTYLERDCLPVLTESARAVGRHRRDLEVVAGVQVITGATERDVARERERQRRQLAFLYSTPAYRGGLERAGLAHLRDPLARMVRDDEWGTLPEVVTDEVLGALIPTATYPELARVITERVGGLADGVTLALPVDPADDHHVARVVAQLRSVPTPSGL